MPKNLKKFLKESIIVELCPKINFGKGTNE